MDSISKWQFTGPGSSPWVEQRWPSSWICGRADTLSLLKSSGENHGLVLLDGFWVKPAKVYQVWFFISRVLFLRVSRTEACQWMLLKQIHLWQLFSSQEGHRGRGGESYTEMSPHETLGMNMNAHILKHTHIPKTAALGIEPKALYMISRYSTTELYPWSLDVLCTNISQVNGKHTAHFEGQVYWTRYLF